VLDERFGGPYFLSVFAANCASSLEYFGSAFTTAILIWLVALSTCGAEMIAETTATPLPPALITSFALLGLMPPIPTIGSDVDSQIYLNLEITITGLSVFVVEG